MAIRCLHKNMVSSNAFRLFVLQATIAAVESDISWIHDMITQAMTFSSPSNPKPSPHTQLSPESRVQWSRGQGELYCAEGFFVVS